MLLLAKLMKSCSFGFLLGAFLMLWTVPVLGFGGRNHTVEVQRYSVSDGLLHNHVYHTFEDGRGFLWLVTLNGLQFFDGKSFITVMKWPVISDPNDARIILEDSSGGLWLRIIENGAPSFYIINSKTRKVVQLANSMPQFLPSSAVDVAKNSKGELLASDKEGRLWRRSEQRNWEVIFQHPNGAFQFLGSQFLGDRFWVKSYTRKANTFQYSCIDLLTFSILFTRTEIGDKALVPFVQDSIWYLGRGSKVRYHLNRVSEHVYPSTVTSVLSSESIVHWVPQKRQLWLFDKQKLLLYDETDQSVFPITKEHLKKQPLGNVFEIRVDSEDIAWVSTINGLFKIRLVPARFTKLFWEDPEDNSNPFTNSCRGIVGHTNGNIFINNNYKTEVYNRRTSKVESQIQFDLAPFGIAKDKDGSVWIGSDHYFLVNYAPDGKRKRTIHPTASLDKGLIWSIYPDVDRVWLGLNGGLGYYDRNLDRVLEYPTQIGMEDLLRADIYYITGEEDKASILLATSNGFYRIDPIEYSVERYWKAGKGQFKLPVENIRHFCKTQKGIYWFASAEGLLKWNPATQQTTLFTTEDGLPHNNLYAVYEDARGFLWISSDYGIIQFDPETEHFRYFLERDGITYSEFNRISHAQLADGTLLFGSLNGVTIFQPADFWDDFFQTAPTNLIVKSASLFDGEIGKEVDVLSHLYDNGWFVIQPSDRYLTLRVAQSDYSISEFVGFTYLIEGLNETWVPIQGDQIQVAGIPPGNYFIKIRAKNWNGNFSESDITIPLRVLAPVYLRPWFLLLLVVLLSAALLWAVKLREKMFKERQLKLEKEVENRTLKITKAKELIEKQSSEIAFLAEEKEKIFTNISHEFRSPISLILGAVRALSRELPPQSKQKELLSIAERNTQQLLDMVNEILNLIVKQGERKVAKKETIHLADQVKQVIADFQLVAKEKGVRLQIETGNFSKLEVEADPSFIQIILTNLLSNAVKFTPQRGRIDVRLVQDMASHTALLTVADTGKGIHAIDLPFIFDRFYQSTLPGAANEGGAGIGLALTKELVESLGGTINVESELGKGSTFSVYLPLAAEQSHCTDLKAGEAPAARQTNWIPESETIKRTILVVEDHPDFQFLLRKHLQESHHIVGVYNGVEALDYLRQHPNPDLIITDLMMPLMDGFQLLAALKSKSVFANIPVLVYSAKGTPTDEAAALRLGASAFRVKPISETELLELIHQLMQAGKSNQTDLLVEIPAFEQLSMEDQSWIRRLNQVTLSELSDPAFSVDQLAQKMLLGRTQFFHEVQRIGNMTPHAFIKEVRLQQARLHLERQELDTPHEVAMLVGFRDEKYFARLYRERFGKSISSYMRKSGVDLRKKE